MSQACASVKVEAVHSLSLPARRLRQVLSPRAYHGPSKPCVSHMHLGTCLQILFGILLERDLATARAEVVGCALILCLESGWALLDSHPAHWIDMLFVAVSCLDMFVMFVHLSLHLKRICFAPRRANRPRGNCTSAFRAPCRSRTRCRAPARNLHRRSRPRATPRRALPAPSR